MRTCRVLMVPETPPGRISAPLLKKTRAARADSPMATRRQQSEAENLYTDGCTRTVTGQESRGHKKHRQPLPARESNQARQRR